MIQIVKMEKRQSDPLPLAFTSTVYTSDFTITTTKTGTQGNAETSTYTTTKPTTSYIPILPFGSTLSSQPPLSGTNGTVTYQVTLYRPPTNLFPSPTPTSSTVTITNHNIVTVSQIAVGTSEVLVGSGAAAGGVSGIPTTLRTAVLNSSITVTYVSTLNSLALFGAAAQTSTTAFQELVKVDGKWSDWSSVQKMTLLLSLLICLIAISTMAIWRRMENDWKTEQRHKEEAEEQAYKRPLPVNRLGFENAFRSVSLVLYNWKSHLIAWAEKGKDGLLLVFSYIKDSGRQQFSNPMDVEIQQDVIGAGQRNAEDSFSVATSLPWLELTTIVPKKHSRVHAPRWYNANTLTTTVISTEDDTHDHEPSKIATFGEHTVTENDTDKVDEEDLQQ